MLFARALRVNTPHYMTIKIDGFKVLGIVSICKVCIMGTIGAKRQESQKSESKKGCKFLFVSVHCEPSKLNTSIYFQPTPRGT